MTIPPPKKDQAAGEDRPLTREGSQAPSGRLQLAATRLSRWAPDGPRAPDRGRLGQQSRRLVRTTPRWGCGTRVVGRGSEGGPRGHTWMAQPQGGLEEGIGACPGPPSPTPEARRPPRPPAFRAAAPGD
ncbi:unnamed protein product [Rangifer tarandus platyrhynchus]|uniref:Uncharacterized protein n=1 Tax=Rangifer tarandus platyrhynchus TaxID=3082113 RepID=A0AC59ZRY1_RANTA